MDGEQLGVVDEGLQVRAAGRGVRQMSGSTCRVVRGGEQEVAATSALDASRCRRLTACVGEGGARMQRGGGEKAEERSGGARRRSGTGPEAVLLVRHGAADVLVESSLSLLHLRLRPQRFLTGRSNAASMSSGRLVAAMTNTPLPTISYSSAPPPLPSP
eukprot:756577-Hanusia_phi.AAC.3